MAGINHGQIVDLEQYAKDSRLTEPSDGKIYDYREMLRVSSDWEDLSWMRKQSNSKLKE